MLSLATEVSEEDCLPLASIRWTWAEVCQSPSLRPLIATIIFIHINYAVTLRVVARPPMAANAYCGSLVLARCHLTLALYLHYPHTVPLSPCVADDRVCSTIPSIWC